MLEPARLAQDVDVVIVGAGVAGLAAAQHLTRAGLTATVLEAAQNVGGRMSTEKVDGFRLDRAGRLLSTAYPELRRTPGLNTLTLRPFSPGVLLHSDGRHHRAAAPSAPRSARGALTAARALASAPRLPRPRPRAEPPAPALSAAPSTRPVSPPRWPVSPPSHRPASSPAPISPPHRRWPPGASRPARSTASCAPSWPRCSATRHSRPPAAARTWRCIPSRRAACVCRRAARTRFRNFSRPRSRRARSTRASRSARSPRPA